MSHADEVRDALRKALWESYKPVFRAGTTYASSANTVRELVDIEDAMRGAVNLIIAAEALTEAAAAAEKAAREALSIAIQETGAPEVVTMQHKAYHSRKPAFVSIDQPDLVPTEYLNEPTLNRTAIKKAIEGGDDVPGCTLIRPNEQSLVIRSRK